MLSIPRTLSLAFVSARIGVFNAFFKAVLIAYSLSMRTKSLGIKLVRLVILICSSMRYLACAFLVVATLGSLFFV
jgi:hypothetical protein